MLRAHSLIVGLVVVACLLTGCSSSSNKDGAAGGGADPSLTRVKNAGKLVICSSNDVPYAYRDPAKNNALTGTDIDMVTAIAKRIGVGNLELNEVPISGIIPALLSSRCDIIADNIAITLKRSEQIAFSNPQYKAGQALVVPKGNPAQIRTERDFAKHSVGSYAGTVQIDWLNELATKDPSITVKTYKDIPEVLADLRAGRLDAAVFDDMVAGYSLKLDPSLPIEIVDYKLPIGDYAVGAGFRKDDNALRQAFNDANRELQVSGELTDILKKWGLTPVERYYPFSNCCK